jgi:hypothetical protein
MFMKNLFFWCKSSYLLAIALIFSLGTSELYAKSECVGFVHGHRATETTRGSLTYKNGKTDQALVKKYFGEGAAANAVKEGNTHIKYIGYNSRYPYFHSKAAGLVARQITALGNSSQCRGRRVVIIGHSMAGAVLSYIYANARRGDINFNTTYTMNDVNQLGKRKFSHHYYKHSCSGWWWWKKCGNKRHNAYRDANLKQDFSNYVDNGSRNARIFEYAAHTISRSGGWVMTIEGANNGTVGGDAICGLVDIKFIGRLASYIAGKFDFACSQGVRSLRTLKIVTPYANSGSSMAVPFYTSGGTNGFTAWYNPLSYAFHGSNDMVIDLSSQLYCHGNNRSIDKYSNGCGHKGKSRVYTLSVSNETHEEGKDAKKNVGFTVNQNLCGKRAVNMIHGIGNCVRRY